MLSVDQALQLISQHTAPLPPQTLPLGEVLGLVLAQEVHSDIDSPPYDKAMMDGFAVVSSDRLPERRIIEEVMAGDLPLETVTLGHVTRVMTGAPIPAGADAVVPVERTELVDEQTVRLEWLDPPAGKHIMPQGTSIAIGQQVLSPGMILSPLEIALLAEVGCSRVAVVPQPRVAILATGNELVPASKRPGPGQIRNSNGPMLAAAVTQTGASAIELPTGHDDLDDLTRLIRQGLDNEQADLLLVAGGVSAGQKDLVPAALQAAGVEQVLHKVAIKPGKPLWFGIRHRPQGLPQLVFGLPGNPVSSFVCFQVFVRPTLDRLAGRRDQVTQQLATGMLAVDYAHKGGRETFHPALVRPAEGSQLPQVELPPWQGSADLASLAGLNAIVRLSKEPQQFSAGDTVEWLRWR